MMDNIIHIMACCLDACMALCMWMGFKCRNEWYGRLYYHDGGLQRWMRPTKYVISVSTCHFDIG
jgi:hypothetical protein